MRLIKSFGFAIKGMCHCMQHEQNFKIHIVLSCAVSAAGWLLRCTASEWLILLLCMAMVIAMEMLNSAIERLCNLYQQGFHAQIKIVKDVAAGAVLVAAIAAATCGAIIFLPKIVSLIQSTHL